MNIVLEAQSREKKEKLSPDFLPAIIYGNGQNSQSLKIKRADLEKTVKMAGESNLINLKVENVSKNVLIKEVQRNGLSGKMNHVDFLEVNMKNKITTEIPVHLIGESKAVREMSGSLIKDLDSLEVECLPEDLVDHIDVDISALKEFHDNISTNDLSLPKGIKLVNLHEQIIVSVIPPRVIAEEIAVESTEKPKAVIESKEEKQENAKK
jgi:large subunit ribosomal protein L25